MEMSPDLEMCLYRSEYRNITELGKEVVRLEGDSLDRPQAAGQAAASSAMRLITELVDLCARRGSGTDCPRLVLTRRA